MAPSGAAAGGDFAKPTFGNIAPEPTAERSRNEATGGAAPEASAGVPLERLRGAQRDMKPAWMTKGIGVGTQIFGEAAKAGSAEELMKPGLTRADLEAIDKNKGQKLAGPDPFGDFFAEANASKDTGPRLNGPGSLGAPLGLGGARAPLPDQDSIFAGARPGSGGASFRGAPLPDQSSIFASANGFPQVAPQMVRPLGLPMNGPGPGLINRVVMPPAGMTMTGGMGMPPSMSPPTMSLPPMNAASPQNPMMGQFMQQQAFGGCGFGGQGGAPTQGVTSKGPAAAPPLGLANPPGLGGCGLQAPPAMMQQFCPPVPQFMPPPPQF